MRRGLAPATALAVMLVGLAGCDLAPAYRPATMALPATYAGEAPFTLARPDDRLPRGPWWRMYGNPTLDGLEDRLPANPTLAAERERYLQARDLAAEARAGLYPQIGATASPSENRESPDQLFRSPTSRAPLQESNVTARASASWDLDLWDRIGNETRNREELAQAEAASLASLALSLQAALARDYILLRGLDQEEEVYRATIRYYQTGVDITQSRLENQIGSGLDVGRARSQLASAQALLLDTEARRAVAMHAIATLLGVPAGTLLLPPQNGLAFAEPVIPVGVPSDLLERRPDVAAAERRMAAANAGIGVTRAAFYPDVTLGGVAGLVTSGFDLFSLPDRAWAVGATLAQPIFEGGLLAAALQASHSRYRQTVDDYRATVLAAMQQVADGLSDTTLLTEEVARDRQAVAAAATVQNLALKLYEAGADSYLDVVVAQVTALTSGTTEVQTATRALQSSVDLVAALGGGWRRAELPTRAETLPFDPLDPG